MTVSRITATHAAHAAREILSFFLSVSRRYLKIPPTVQGRKNAEMSARYCNTLSILQLAVAHGARKRNDIADVRHAREVHYATLEAETVACVTCASVFSEVKIERV